MILVCRVCWVTMLEPVLCYFLFPLTMDTNSRNILSHCSYMRVLLLHQHFSQRAKHAHDYFLCFTNTRRIVKAKVLHLPFRLSGLETLGNKPTSSGTVLLTTLSSRAARERCLQGCSVQPPTWVTSSTAESSTDSPFKYASINSEVSSGVLPFLCHSNPYFLCPFFELPSLVLFP